METAGPLSLKGHDWGSDWGETEGEVSGLASGLDVSVRVVDESRMSPRRQCRLMVVPVTEVQEAGRGTGFGVGSVY